MRRGRQGALPPHPDEEDLRALAADDAVDEAVRSHVAGCAGCQARVDELRRLLAVLQEAAAREERPRHDMMGRTLARLRQRQAAATGTNELLATLAGIWQAVLALLPRAPHDEASSPRQHHEGGTTP